MNTEAIQEWLKLSDRTKQNIFEETAKLVGLPNAAAVEKDWWVVRTLELIYKSSIAQHTVFKGGTSLSKAWGLIDRFSEDIDLALDRSLLGFVKTDQEMTGSQVAKLRRKSFRFISEVFFPEMQALFVDAGFEDVTLKPGEIRSPDEDPLIIEVYYKSVTEQINYIQPRVLIEIGSRSLIEPFTNCSFRSLVGEQFEGRLFADKNITIPTVNPEMTLLEKVFLLHERFQIVKDDVKVERRSRHLYDLDKLMDTEFAQSALKDKALYETIVEHRSKLTAERGIDYANHIPSKITIIPPEAIKDEWEKDYKLMQESMFYNPSRPFEELLDRIQELQARINKIRF